MTPQHPRLLDDRFPAAVDLLRRTGAKEVQIRWSDDEDPTVWFTVVEWRVDPHRAVPVAEGEIDDAQRGLEVAAALDPLTATLRLCERILDSSSRCVHCSRPGGFAADLDTPADADVRCYYQWDPELKTFRRSCEGDFKAPGRNEPCWCGSGEKFKRCHGA